MLPLVVLITAAALAGALALAHLAGRAQVMAQAQTAADAAALAAAGYQREDAAELASANGAELVGVDIVDGMARVEITLDGETALAAAERPREALAPALAAALDRAGEILGQDVGGAVRLLGPLGSGGIEVPRPLAPRLAALSHRTGLCRAGGGRPLHFVLCPAIHRG
ncbi:MAG: hypothetical protein F4Y94_02255 [Chloroflexi bacterium]|nr:hypothetical protein [Chloroflexota bacterium]